MFDLLHNASVEVFRPRVIPAQAGIQVAAKGRLDARFRGHDSPTLKTAKRKAL